MKRLDLLSVFLALPMMSGCAKSTTTLPTTTLAPGYLSTADQTLGQSIAALNAFVTNESTVNYPKLSASLQALEKPYLNNLITATNLANTAYIAYHANTGTLTAAQTALTTALTAQNNLTNAVGAHN